MWGKILAEKRGLKLVLIDYTLPLLLKKFLVKNHASNIPDFTVVNDEVEKVYLKL